ncbi:MAG TPA: cadmium resistance transporter [Acidimicrobiales bacterium]
MTHVLTTARSGLWPFVVTNVDDFVLLTALFVTVGRGGPSNRQIVAGQYLGMALLVTASALAALGLSTVPERWIGLLGLIPIGLGLRGLSVARRTPAGDDMRAAVTGMAGVAALTISDGADNVSVYIPLFRQAGAGVTGTYVLVFAVLVGVWCAVARAVAARRQLIAVIEHVGHWLVPLVYIAIGIRIVVVSGLLGG